MPPSDEPFHRGERLVQDRVGVGARMAVAGRHAIREYMTEQHREFFESLPFVVVGSVDDSGQPWASVLAGPPGFMTFNGTIDSIVNRMLKPMALNTPKDAK